MILGVDGKNVMLAGMDDWDPGLNNTAGDYRVPASLINTFTDAEIEIVWSIRRPEREVPRS